VCNNKLNSFLGLDVQFFVVQEDRARIIVEKKHWTFGEEGQYTSHTRHDKVKQNGLNKNWAYEFNILLCFIFHCLKLYSHQHCCVCLRVKRIAEVLNVTCRYRHLPISSPTDIVTYRYPTKQCIFLTTTNWKLFSKDFKIRCLKQRSKAC